MAAPFVILALPRSRTAWLSVWLTHGGRTCYHDALAYTHTRDDLRGLTAGGNGMAETAGIALPRVLHNVLPGARYLIVRRDPQHVTASLDRIGALFSRTCIEIGQRALDDAAAFLRPRADVMEIDFEDLDTTSGLSEVWRFLRGDEHDLRRTQALRQMRITKLDPMAGFPPRDLLAEEQRLKQENP